MLWASISRLRTGQAPEPQYHLSLIHISSLEVDAIEDAIVRSDLTDMNDLMMELIKEVGKE